MSLKQRLQKLEDQSANKTRRIGFFFTFGGQEPCGYRFKDIVTMREAGETEDDLQCRMQEAANAAYGDGERVRFFEPV